MSQSLESLRGLPLAVLDLGGCTKVSDSGLKYLRGLPLCKLDLSGCGLTSGDGLKVLRGMPLTDLNLNRYRAAECDFGHDT